MRQRGRERTDGRERSSANLRACSLLGVLLTVASDEAPKVLLEEEEDSLPLSSSSPPCSSSMSMAVWRGLFLRLELRLSCPTTAPKASPFYTSYSRQREKGCHVTTVTCRDHPLRRADYFNHLGMKLGVGWMEGELQQSCLFADGSPFPKTHPVHPNVSWSFTFIVSLDD